MIYSEVSVLGELLTTYTGLFPDSILMNPGSVLVAGAAPENSYYLDEAWVPLPTKPSPNHKFNWLTKQWEDPRTLADLKAAQWTQIKAARETAINAPLETPYGTVDSGPDDRGNITDAVMLLQTMESLGTPITIEFTMFDNTPITLTTAQMVHIGLLLGQKVQAAYVRSQARRAEIDAATTKEAIEAVVW